ncbi:MAG TPA: hypothetical protein DDX19_21240 [Rhodopirellula baltica]|uniref:Uncharacterized protein n=2 Tax=Rhodopirellula baltica TaxID=265606 RepID=F2AS07_RHOBT|nr:hypothetical protein RBWH47_02454 [Rhodopirellula baltica WH47]ELP32430.1 hypothetical protein RBSWK_03562 [Rhodopirellula baltica SWK14]HBE65232.1 hypothetical protein [Rhodopirellula baltica]
MSLSESIRTALHNNFLSAAERPHFRQTNSADRICSANNGKAAARVDLSHLQIDFLGSFD